jgi:hypothetical protein
VLWVFPICTFNENDRLFYLAYIRADTSEVSLIPVNCCDRAHRCWLCHTPAAVLLETGVQIGRCPALGRQGAAAGAAAAAVLALNVLLVLQTVGVPLPAALAISG